MSLATDFQLISNLDFKGRVTIAILRAATAIKNEDPSTPLHAQRLVWALALNSFQTADAMAGQFLPNVIANPTISAAGPAATDGDIEFTVNGLVNQYIPEA